MQKKSVSELKGCIHRGDKNGQFVGCSNIPVYKCDIHGKCVMWKTCKTGSLKICKNCTDFEKNNG